MKKLNFTLIMVIAVLITALITGATKAMAGWHDWTQQQRNQAIVDRAYEDNNDWVGVSCKEWVRTVVYDASIGTITIPATHPDLYYWYPHTYVVGRSALIQYAQPGEIVQMKLNSGYPHTAIVVSVSAYGITFIESNWDNTPENYSDAYVHTRYVTFTDFYNQVENYTIMYIL